MKKIQEKIEKKKEKTKTKHRNLIKDFKAFISKGSVLDMAVGVIMGGAFGAIVTSVVNLLLTLCTWGIPGGINGLVSVLPALNDAQRLPETLASLDPDGNGILTVAQWANLSATQQGLFVKYGANYYYNALPVLNWGTFLTAVINFLIISLILFSILKTFSYLKAKKKEYEVIVLEKYYQKHPEERPAPVDPVKPLPTEVELLTQIKDQLITLNTNKKKEE